MMTLKMMMTTDDEGDGREDDYHDGDGEEDEEFSMFFEFSGNTGESGNSTGGSAGRSYSAARQAEENKLREVYVETLILSQGLKTWAGSSTMEPPRCYENCGNEATIYCQRCSASGRYLCCACDSKAHGRDKIHPRHSLNANGTMSRYPPSRLRFEPDHCVECLMGLRDVAIPDNEKSIEVVKLITNGRGVHQVEVVSFICPHCKNRTGTSPLEFSCISGTGGGSVGGCAVWVERELLDRDRALYITSGFRLSAESHRRLTLLRLPNTPPF